MAQICALVSFTKNCGTKLVWAGCSWLNEIPDPIFSLVYLRMDTDFFPFILQKRRRHVLNIHEVQSGTSPLSSRKRFGRIPGHSR